MISMKASIVPGLLALCLLHPSNAPAQTPPPREILTYPMLMDVAPLAVQVGQTGEHDVRSRYTLEGAYQVLVSGSGVTAEVVPPPEPPAAEPPASAKPVANP